MLYVFQNRFKLHFCSRLCNDIPEPSASHPYHSDRWHRTLYRLRLYWRFLLFLLLLNVSGFFRSFLRNFSANSSVCM